MGKLPELSSTASTEGFEITLKDAAQEKEFIDELRIRNGNLEISMINGREDAFNEL